LNFLQIHTQESFIIIDIRYQQGQIGNRQQKYIFKIAPIRWALNANFLPTDTYAAFILVGFDDQERNLTFVKTAFQILKLKVHACSMKQVFYPLNKLNTARA